MISHTYFSTGMLSTRRDFQITSTLQVLFHRIANKINNHGQITDEEED